MTIDKCPKEWYNHTIAGIKCIIYIAKNCSEHIDSPNKMYNNALRGKEKIVEIYILPIRVLTYPPKWCIIKYDLL